jgi:HNH endonuclease
MAKRPPIQSDLQRSVLIEAGHRCALPTCRQIPVVIAHIVAWSKCKVHEFENLIALCPTCHARFDKGEIDRKSMLVYKQNLANLNRRYGDLERRVVELFARNPDRDDIWVLDNMEILLMYLLEDGIIRPTGLVEEIKEKSLSKKQYQLTEKGRDSISRSFRPGLADV